MDSPAPAPVPARECYSWWEMTRDTANNNMEGIRRCIQHAPEFTKAALGRSAKFGHVEMTLLLLAMHPDAQMGTLCTAVEHDHPALVRALIPRTPDGIAYGFRMAVGRGNVPVLNLFLEVDLSRLDSGLVQAVFYQQSGSIRRLIDAGATSFTSAMNVSSLDTPMDDIQLLIEKGATGWPSHVYRRLARDPERIVHLLKCGIPRALLTGGHAPIQAIVDEQDRRDALIRAELDKLGVYKVLADLIVQY